MRIVVTGGGGFIGSHLVDALVARGDTCTVLDDFSRGDPANLEHHGESVQVVQGSVADRGLVHDVVGGHDAVFHLASVVGVRSSIADPARVVEVSVAGTANVLDAASSDVPVLVASSSEVYGRSEAVPFDEWTPALLGPPQAARWSYAHAKACAEHLALARGNASVVRYFNVYGPRMPRHVDPSVVSRFLEAAGAGEDLPVHGDGGQTRNFVFVRDAVDGTLAALEGGRGRVINLGGPHETTVAQLASLVLAVSGSSSCLRSIELPDVLGSADEQPQRRSASGELAAQLLGWHPRTDLAEGLAATWAAWTDGHPSGSRLYPQTVLAARAV